MAARYNLEPLTAAEADRWDELIAPFESRQLFHRKAWLDYLAASRGLTIRFWAIRSGNQTVGYFCGGILRKGPFRILGSPLKGWGTNFLGPVVNRDFDQGAFLRALDDLAASERLAMVEIENPVLSERNLEKSGYDPVPQPTYIVELAPGETERMWNLLELKSRQKVRKAIRSGLTVEDTADAQVAEEFYDQFVEVLSRKNLYPPYHRDCPRLLFQSLKPLDMLFALRIRDPEGKVIATGLFPHDDQTVYFWGGASRIAAWNHSPNDLLQWSVMEMAAARGLRVYNMCGYGYFKSKFGGTLRHPKRWHKCYSETARWARRGYEVFFQNQIRLRGWWQRVVSTRGGV